MIDTGFASRYDAVLAKWPIPPEAVDVTSRFGTTRVNTCGEGDGVPILLLPGGRSTSAVWYATVGALAPHRKVYAVDLILDRGRSRPDGDPITTVDQVVEWLGTVADGLGLERFALAGHSFGAWIAGHYAIAKPERVAGLVLFDPTDILSPTTLAFRLRGIKLFLTRRNDRFARFLAWETSERPIDPVFAALWSGSSDQSDGATKADHGGMEPGQGMADAEHLQAQAERKSRAPKMSWFRLPSPEQRARLTMPVLVYAPRASRQNDPAALIAAARSLPDATVIEIPEASHFTVPQQHPGEINPPLMDFLAGVDAKVSTKG